METFVSVRPEHLNHFDKLFGGQMLKWVDEFAWLAAARDYPGCALVTRAMDNVEFRRGVDSGAILRFDVQQGTLGKTSVTYAVAVHATPYGSQAEEEVFRTSVTFVCIDKTGEKTCLCKGRCR